MGETHLNSYLCSNSYSNLGIAVGGELAAHLVRAPCPCTHLVRHWALLQFLFWELESNLGIAVAGDTIPTHDIYLAEYLPV